MAHGPWTVASDDNDYVVWTCTKCGAEVGFWKPGNPSGSTPTATADAYPENIDVYAGKECAQ